MNSLKNPTIIAEVKTISPFGFTAVETWDELFDLAVSVGDIISIHTDPRWGGSLGHISMARARTTKPILAKGIHESDEELIKAFSLGADLALVVGRVPNSPFIPLNKCLIEPNSLEELTLLVEEARRLSNNPEFNVKIVWNGRDLATGGIKTETFADARNLYSGWMCQASNIKTIEDVDQTAQAVLVGSHLEEFVQSLKSI